MGYIREQRTLTRQFNNMRVHWTRACHGDYKIVGPTCAPAEAILFVAFRVLACFVSIVDSRGAVIDVFSLI